MAKIAETDLPLQVAHARRQAFNQGTDKPIKDLQDECGLYAYNLALCYDQSKWKKQQRVWNRIKDCVTSSRCVFLTFTFRDDVLAQTDEQTRRRFVRRCIKSQCPHNYVANIDFGNAGAEREYIDRDGNKRTSTAREHYHAIAVLPDGVKRFDMSQWKHGFMFVERVPIHDKKIVANYVAKLSLHALKEHGQKPRMLIYSRE